MNRLTQINSEFLKTIESLRDQLIEKHQSTPKPSFNEYPLPKLKHQIKHVLSEHWGKGNLEPQFDIIDRGKFGGDIALKFPQLLRDGGPKKFIENHIPWITKILAGPAFTDSIKKIETKGMYINLTLNDHWLLNSAQAVVDLDSHFGLVDSFADRTFVVDYSSPNVAKVLHAGHIRSTIIGHVLSNLYEACGALVYRINHINDFGGFGFTLEGYRRFQNYFPHQFSNNDKLLEIYRIRRTAEKIIESMLSFENLSEDELKLIKLYFPDANNPDILKSQYLDFVAAADRRFAALESGNAEEVELWQQMVNWSLSDFAQFYDMLQIHFDLTVGESFYFAAGNQLADRCIQSGLAVVYTKSLAEQDIQHLNTKLSQEKITQAEHDKLIQAIEKDIGAVVIPLDNHERYVIRRADGRSIYSTRDLGAIERRSQIFNPTDIIYVVGQEQKVHFDRLFRSAYKIGLAQKEKIRFQHLFFGFYVDASTGKKLSSRDTVANVNHLLLASVQHFRSRLSDRTNESEEEIQQAANELAVGSLVFNDLKQDMKGSVDINAKDLNATIAGFEKSGGAYVVYSACRARSILRKHNQKPLPADQIKNFQIDEQEASLLLQLQELPERIISAANQANPSILVRHLLNIATVYNSYYVRAQVITNGVANQSRLLITHAVQQVLSNGLKLCHVTCPQAI